MPGRYDYDHDDEGNVILVQYGTPPEHLRRTGRIRPYTPEERALIRQRQDEQEAERKRQEARIRAEAMKELNDEIAARRKNSPVNPQKRALRLDD